jgi:hypothetical protein
MLLDTVSQDYRYSGDEGMEHRKTLLSSVLTAKLRRPWRHQVERDKSIEGKQQCVSLATTHR